MAARSTILGGDFTVYYAAENNRKQVKWTGSLVGTRTLNEFYSALQDLFDEPAQMDDLIPIRADTPDIYRMINQWFIDDDSVEHLTGGSLFTDGWAVGTTQHVKLIGYANLGSPPSDLSTHDIGRTVHGTTTADTGTLLDFNSGRGLMWIRPDDPVVTTGDDFDDGDESWSISGGLGSPVTGGDPIDEVWQVDGVNRHGNAPVYVDETTNANTGGGAADWTIFPAVESGAGSPIGGSPLSSDGPADYAAMGYFQEFSSITFNSEGETIGVGGTVAWEYWNGTAWTALTNVTDDTTGFTAVASNNQVVRWDTPTDWATTSLNSGAQLFFVRARVLTIYSTNPIYDNGRISGVGNGTFISHPRHGCASVGGEAAWAGITTIGAIESNTHIYVFQEDFDKPAGDFEEEKVLATKGTSDWWSDGQIDILLKTMEADSVAGERPDAARTAGLGVATVFARKFTSLYSHFIAESLSTTGGNTVVPLASGADLNNTTGYRNLILEGNVTGSFVVDDLIASDAVGFGSPLNAPGSPASTTPLAVVTAVGTGSPIDLDYYLINDPLTDFSAGNTVSNITRAGSGEVNGTPTDVGPALDQGITIVFGATTEDINNGNGARPFSIRVDPNSVSFVNIYERLKYLTRRGATDSIPKPFQGQDGEEYLGNELQIEYTALNHGPTGENVWAEGDKVFDQTTNAEGIIVADHTDGSPQVAGDIIVKALRGTFTAGNIISDSPDPTQDVGSALSLEDPSTWIDNTTSAGSPPGNFNLFPATNNAGDIFYVGASQVFARVRFDIAVNGVDGGALVLAWEYYNGEGWSDLSGVGGSPPVSQFTDETVNFTLGGSPLGLPGSPRLEGQPSDSDVFFYPPRDWEPTTVNATAVPCVGPFYYIRARIHGGTYSTAPQAGQILIQDNVSATATTLRSIAVVPASPFGTLAGGTFFGAPGVTVTASNVLAGEEQSYQLIDDDGVTQVPPNTVSVTVTQLLCGDAVAVFRRTGTDINKTQFNLAPDGSPPGNTLGESTITVDAPNIPADNPTNANSKIRVVSVSGVEHRYRYDSYSGRHFTLSPASAGTTTAGTTTTLTDAAATFLTDEVEVGDYVSNTPDASFARITDVVSQTTLTTDETDDWFVAGKAYSVNTLVQNYTATDSAYVPLIERIAGVGSPSPCLGSPLTADISEGNQLVQSTNIDVRVVVRNAGNILPFSQDATITSSGLSLATIRTADSIFT